MKQEEENWPRTATMCLGTARLFPSAVGEPSWCQASASSQDRPPPPTFQRNQSLGSLLPHEDAPLPGHAPQPGLLRQAPSPALSHRSGRPGHGVRCAGNDLTACGPAVRLHRRPSRDRSVCSLLYSQRPCVNGSSQAGRPTVSERHVSCRDCPHTYPSLDARERGHGEREHWEKLKQRKPGTDQAASWQGAVPVIGPPVKSTARRLAEEHQVPSSLCSTKTSPRPRRSKGPMPVPTDLFLDLAAEGQERPEIFRSAAVWQHLQ